MAFNETFEGQTFFDPEAERKARNKEIDPLEEVRKHRFFKIYSAIWWVRLRLSIIFYKLADWLANV